MPHRPRCNGENVGSGTAAGVHSHEDESEPAVTHTDGGIDQKNGGIPWAKYRISKLDVTAILTQSKFNLQNR